MLRFTRDITPRAIARFALALLVLAIPAAADAAQRTFVASYGSDGGACTLGAPCRSFGTALTHTDPDGEIIVLDSAGYGRATIDKSVSIVAPSGVYAGVSVFAGTNGIDIDTPGVVVVLRGLATNGQGGDIGIRFTQGSRLYVEQCTVSNMGTRGISLEAGEAYVNDTAIRDNGSNGIWVQTGTLALDRSRIEGNGAAGLRVLNALTVAVTNSIITGNHSTGGVDIDSDDGATQVAVTITDSSVSQNASYGILAQAANAGSIVRLAVSRSTISRNSFTGISMTASTGTLTGVVTDNTVSRNFGSGGILASGAGVSVTVANNAVSGNGAYGILQAVSAVLKTRNNNVVQDNSTDISGTLTFVAGD